MPTIQCFCLYSQGDLEDIIEEHHQYYIKMWEWSYLAPKDEFSWKNFGMAVLWTPFQMVLHVFDAVRKSFLLIGNFFALLYCHKDANERALILVDNFCALLICCLGILIPPLAFYLDSLAQEYFTALAQ